MPSFEKPLDNDLLEFLGLSWNLDLEPDANETCEESTLPKEPLPKEHPELMTRPLTFLKTVGEETLCRLLIKN